ncbi:MalY/PatB family protein [Kocuria sp.]|uniref:MalY/PatB family protein n=1 Tax=Kocuria sp. TaxID=1871328 RepID=UPI0026DF00FE|nr:aminotransferase class I/II-fold pyridoxal phosphate-dependent enzyme [Kocuria sp.]MDO5617591.1 aminotransferase class I/II-fold pyridoxal phosphate-dependent enzyme [Kocuria sp.]
MTPAVTNPLESVPLEQLRKRTSEKWHHYPPEVLPLWVAEMDVIPARPIRQAVQEAVESGDTGYPSGDVYPQALSDFAARRWGWTGAEPQRMRTVPDVMTGISAAISALTDPGDTVIVCSPVYPPFYVYTKHLGRKVVEAPLTPGGRLDPEAVQATFQRISGTTRQPVLLLANPHNPTGVVHTRAELEAVAALARKFNARVISDEIHAPLVLPGAHFVPYLSVTGTEPDFAVFSASKAWNLAGFKAAVLQAGSEATQDLARVPWTVDAGASHLGILAHVAALQHGQPWLDTLLAGLASNRRLLQELVEQHAPGLRFQPPEATYLAWLDCSQVDLPAAEPGSLSRQFRLTGPAGFFLDHAGVALNDGSTFGTGGRGFVRLNFGTSPTILSIAVERMGAALAAVG